MTDAWDDEDRAIARALGVDAPGDGATARISSDAVAEYETVLAQLPFDEVPPRPELENEVVAAALARRPAAARAIDGPRSARRSVSPRWLAIGVSVAAAAAIVIVLAVSRPGAGPNPPGARIAAVASTDNMARVLEDPQTRKGVLRSANGLIDGRVALGPDGQGFLYERRPLRSPGSQWSRPWRSSSCTAGTAHGRSCRSDPARYSC